jgi:hypothetical protein
MSPYLAICLLSYSAGLAVAAIHYYYGPVAAINFLAMAGLFDVS